MTWWVKKAEKALINIGIVRLSPQQCPQSWLWGNQIEDEKKKLLCTANSYFTKVIIITQNLLRKRNKLFQKFAERNGSFNILLWKDSTAESLIVFTSAKTSFTRILFNSII